ncbi:MAG: PDZ domain-containing protein [Planctomycetaceae bacterium]|nr:PDZ domain-containing protein [Planctomycetaceae bacterium]
MQLRAGVGMFLLVCSADIFGLADESAVPQMPPSDVAIRQWIAELESPQFSVREQASQQLRKAGAAAVPALVAATKSPSREVSIRATDVLTYLYRADTTTTAAGIEDAIAELRTMPGIVGDLAQSSWDANAGNREERTLAQLQDLGARIQYRVEQDPLVPGIRKSGRRPIQMIVISRAWTGGDEGLKLLERISDPAEIHVYHVNGAKVSDKAMEGVVDLGFLVDRRGAFLGISGGGRRFFGQPNVCDISGVTKGSPAEKAGLQANDIVTKFGDAEVPDFETLIDMLKKTEPGDKVTVTILRGGVESTLNVELGDW